MGLILRENKFLLFVECVNSNEWCKPLTCLLNMWTAIYKILILYFLIVVYSKYWLNFTALKYSPWLPYANLFNQLLQRRKQTNTHYLQDTSVRTNYYKLTTGLNWSFIKHSIYEWWEAIVSFKTFHFMQILQRIPKCLLV